MGRVERVGGGRLKRKDYAKFPPRPPRPIILRSPAKSGDVSWAYARLEWLDGTHREAWLRTGEGYSFTARVAAHTAIRLSDGHVDPGAFTPGALFGADLARSAGAQIITPGAVTS